jgi:hypothetical protein
MAAAHSYPQHSAGISNMKKKTSVKFVGLRLSGVAGGLLLLAAHICRNVLARHGYVMATFMSLRARCQNIPLY